MPLEFQDIRRGIASRDDIGNDLRVHSRTGEQDGDVSNTRMGVQHCLDLPDFHPVPPYLDHAIPAAEVLVVAAIKEGNAVTGAIWPAVPSRPVSREPRVGSERAGVCHCEYRSPRAASHFRYGASMSPPNAFQVAMPASSQTRYSTLGTALMI